MENKLRCIFLAILLGLLVSGCAGNKEEDSTAAGNYPFDRLGVMKEETRLGPTPEEGRVISEEEFQTPPAENEIKLRYIFRKAESTFPYREAETTKAYSFTFSADSAAKAVYPMEVALAEQGGLFAGQVPALGGDMSYLYHYSACRAYRLMTPKERESLGAPLLYIRGYDSRSDSWDLFVLTEEGQMVAGVWEVEAYWSDWTAAPAELYISQETLPEVVCMHLAALGLRHLQDRESLLALDPADWVKSETPAESLCLSSEKWKAYLNPGLFEGFRAWLREE